MENQGWGWEGEGEEYTAGTQARWISAMALSTRPRCADTECLQPRLWLGVCVCLILQRAHGDVKVKGRPEPYAYVPLMGQKLNPRKRAKLAGQFRGVVRKAKAGSAAGTRQRGRNKRE